MEEDPILPPPATTGDSAGAPRRRGGGVRRVAMGVVRGVGWTLAALVGLLAVVMALLYMPVVQDALMPTALRIASDAAGMEIAAGRVRLVWPLRLSVGDVRMVAAPGDTMLLLRHARLQVDPLPLLGLEVRAQCEVEGVEYRLGTPDSIMHLRAVAEALRLHPSLYDLRHQRICVSRAEVEGGDVLLLIAGEDTAAPVDTAAPMPLTVAAERVVLRNVRYRMAMAGIIDSLDATVPVAELTGGSLDMLSRTVSAKALSVDSLTATYLTPPADSLVGQEGATAPQSPDSLAWTVTADRVRLTGREATYAVSGASPRTGLDLDYLQASAIELSVDSFYNRGMEVSCHLPHIGATERCGIRVDASGHFAMDSMAIRADGFTFSTIYSTAVVDALLGMGDFASDPALPLRLRAHAEVGIPDLALAYPDMRQLLDALPDSRDVALDAELDGTLGEMTIGRVAAGMRDYWSLAATGRVVGATDPATMSGHIDLDGRLPNLQFAKAMALPPAMAHEVDIPPIVLSGAVDMRRGAYDGSLAATVDDSGDVLLRASWDGRQEDYAASLALDRFPVGSLLPGLGVGATTASLAVDGHGTDIYAPTTRLRAEAEVASVVYNNKVYDGVRLWATLDSGEVNAGLLSTNSDASVDITLSGTLAAGAMDIELDGDVHNLDLRALGLTTDPCCGQLTLEGSLHALPDSALYDARLGVSGLEWTMAGMELYTPTIDLALAADSAATDLRLRNVDLSADFHSPRRLDSLLTSLADASALALAMADSRRVAVDTLQMALPPFLLDMSASGSENLLASILAASDMSVKRIGLHAANDTALALAAEAVGIRAGTSRIDTVALAANQRGAILDFRAAMDNRPGTLDDFAHVVLSGQVGRDGLSARLDQRNIAGRTGYRLGADLAMVDSTLTLRLAPLDPVIAYKGWTLNSDNHIAVDLRRRRLAADLRLEGAAGGKLALYTRGDTLAGGDTSERLMLTAAGIEIADWLSLSPLAPPVSGVAGADISVDWDPVGRSLLGSGSVSLDGLRYDGQALGSLLLAVDAATDTTGAISADASLTLDGRRVLSAYGVVDRSLFADTLATAAADTHAAAAASPMAMGVALTRMPLRLANPFMPQGTATMEGYLSGNMRMGGTLDAPLLDGFLRFDSAAVKVAMVGTRFAFAPDSIPIDSSIVSFNRYTITGRNANPLRVDGTVDLRSLVAPRADLTLKASNMQVLDARRSSGTDIYGKAFIDLDASVRGNLDYMRVNATLALLAGSNLTYVMNLAGGDLSTLSPDDDNMVRFVNFTDPEAVVAADSVAAAGMALLLDARLVVDDGTTIGVDLSTSGSDRVQLQGAGTLNCTMNPFSDLRVTGRYTLDKGFARYTPPLMTEKLFDFRPGSYVAFNGDMLNPVLDIHADDVIRANVTEEGRDSRLVDFVVTLDVTGTMQAMDVAFDLSTDDDLTISNELQSMSQSQRANQAMNMLLYNVYTGPGTKAGSALSANPLFAFLTSRLNTWAANTIQGVDISFGIDQYDRTADGSTSTATSYSYKVSKTLFNDRVKIVVGGNYSTDADTDENFSQNLINDISFEYMLNRSGTTYLRLFRHVGYEDILEGEVTQTGVGFVYKRKLRSLRDLFGFARRRQSAPQPPIRQANEAE